MAVRTDITVDFTRSPRLITVAAPSVAVSIQDLHDTLRTIEARPRNMDDPRLISSAGKEALGSGVTVGITSTLQNAQISFAARTTPKSSGTVTTANAAGTTLIDSAATFIADGVIAGGMVSNDTDGSLATILSVDSEIQLTTVVLAEGTDNDYDSADAYRVWNIVQCSVDGGNLVAVDGLGAELGSIFTTAFTQVVRTSSSSATLQELGAIQFSSFAGGVTVDLTTPFSGTNFPVGTPEQPVNNFTDALAIAVTRGLKTLFILGNATVDAGLVFDGLTFEGESETKSDLIIDAAASVIGCEFREATVNGTLDGNSKIEHCRIGNLNFVDGFIEMCVLDGPITLGGAAPAHFLNCWSGVIGTTTPVIDMGGGGQALAMRGYNGGIKLINKTGADAVSIDLVSGQVILDATVTAGAILIRGQGKLTDNSGGTATVDSTDLIEGITIRTIERLLRNRTETNPATGVMTLYADDNVTPLLTASIFEDVAGTSPYKAASTKIDRRNRLN